MMLSDSRQAAAGKGATIQSSWRGGLDFLSRTNYLFQPGSAAHLKFDYIHVYIYRAVLEVNYLFHAESARKLFIIKKNIAPPLSLDIEWWPLSAYH